MYVGLNKERWIDSVTNGSLLYVYLLPEKLSKLLLELLPELIRGGASSVTSLVSILVVPSGL